MGINVESSTTTSFTDSTLSGADDRAEVETESDLSSSAQAQTATDVMANARVVNIESTGMLPVSSPLPAGTEVYVGDIDLEDEIIVLINPTDKVRDLTGYKVADESEKHVFNIPDGTIIEANGVLRIYCDSKKVASPKEPFIFWLNKNGKPRRAPLLNNEGDEINLFDKDDNVVSRCRKLEEDSAPTYVRN